MCIRDRHLTTTNAIIPHESERLNWFTTIALVIFHAGAIAALFFFTWKLLLITVALYWTTTGLGISLGYHRLHTHRSFKTPIWLDYTFAVCGALTLEGGPISWVATHRIHHQKSDHDGDPHSPRDGVWWSHVGWLLFGEANYMNTKGMSKYAPDLAKKPFYVWLKMCIRDRVRHVSLNRPECSRRRCSPASYSEPGVDQLHLDI